MIRYSNGIFELHTKNTSYLFGLLPTGHLEHYYYGRKIRVHSAEGLKEKHAFAPGNTISYNAEHPEYSLEDCCLEVNGYGKGDVREPFVEVVHEDGSQTCDFVYDSYEIGNCKQYPTQLPGSYDESGEVETLLVRLKDKSYPLTLVLQYCVYETCDVITRTATLINEGDTAVSVKRLLSLQLDLPSMGFRMSTFTGGWAREMHRTDTVVQAGKLVNSSMTGTSSNRANPFVMLSEEHTTEDFGTAYGFNIIYSGNHYEACEVSSYGKTRFVCGMNPQCFSWQLDGGEVLEAPEAVMTFSNNGFNGMSQNMHGFIREHIVRGAWKKKPRPILLNSWEAAYFDINEHKLLKLAKAAADVGVELFVMDDGWFGTRDDDTQSLGDWTVNTGKLPGGLKGLCDKVKKLGLDFGIWVEPEMVNVKSKLYETHPEWVLHIPGKHHSEGRNQRILDLTNPEVQEYIITEMTKVFASADISYVKWDMNRIFSDAYAPFLESSRQGEVFHRYVLGLYHCMKELTERFPHILFEGCASGGNRFDLGILCYFPQIWASDNTDAICRAEIQNGYSYGYPLSTISAHVSSCPNHQTLRVTPLETRFHVAAFGVCGYECNFCDMKKEDLEAVKEQILLYKKWREVLQFGTFIRGNNGYPAETPLSALSRNSENCMIWNCVSEDRSKAVGITLQKLVVPNSPYLEYHAAGLKEDALYHFYNRELKYNVKGFGDLVNTVAPIHIKQDSLVHDLVAKFVKMDGEKEDLLAYGDELMYAGVKCKQGFAGTGYNEQVRFYQDFASRMYFCEEVNE